MERKIPHEAITPNRAQGRTPSGREIAEVAPLSLTDGGLSRLQELDIQSHPTQPDQPNNKLNDPEYQRSIIEASRRSPGRVLH